MATTRELEQAGRKASPWVGRGARLGAVSRGVIYLVVGGFALQAAFGSRGHPAGPSGVFDAIVRQPVGRPLLALLAIGLAGYALWDFVRAALDPDREARTATQILQRIGWAVGGLVSSALAVTALRAVLNLGRVTSEDQEARGWTATVMAAPLGPWIVGVTGTVIVVVGLMFLWKGWRADVDSDLGSTPLHPGVRRWIVHFGRFGMVARGTVLTLIGAFLVVAVVDANPQEARGVAGALAALAQQPYGRWLLGAVATGFISYGLYEVLRARYSRFDMFSPRS
jgi:Domain of Unknown Function (DUF1206)